MFDKKEWTKKYYQVNKNKIALRDKERYQLNKEKRSVQVRENYQNNIEKRREQYKKYSQTEKGRAVRANCDHRRRTQKKTTDITSDFLIWLKEKIGDVCPYCLEITEKWHLDHIIPLSRGGTHSKDNVIWCCAMCNRIKNALLPEEFAKVIVRILSST